MIQPLWRTVWRFLKKLKIDLPYAPAIPLLGIYPEKTTIQKGICTPMFIAALFTIARSREQTSVNQWGEGRGRGKIGGEDSWVQTTKIGRASCRERV